MKRNSVYPLWVPRAFDPISSLPPSLIPHCQSAYFMMATVIRRLAYGDHKCARLHMKHLREVLARNQCSKIIKALRDSGDIQRVGCYIPGKQSFGYLPGEEYRTDNLRRFIPTEPQLIERIGKAAATIEARNAERYLPIHDFWRECQYQLTIDIELARDILNTSVPPASNPFGTQTLQAELVNSKEHRLSVDAYRSTVFCKLKGRL